MHIMRDMAGMHDFFKDVYSINPRNILYVILASNSYSARKYSSFC